MTPPETRITDEQRAEWARLFQEPAPEPYSVDRCAIGGRAEVALRCTERCYQAFEAARTAVPALLAENAALKQENADLAARRAEDGEWKESILNAVRAIPEFTTGHWAGDKEGWGFVFELIRWQTREVADLRAARDALAAERDEARGELKLADYERSSAFEAAMILLKALGWESGGIASAAQEAADRLASLTAERDALAAELAKANRRVDDVLDKAEKFRDERDKLQAFKDWVHAYLDAHGVPHHPPGTHGAEGCRIGDRMDWLMAKLEEANDTAEAWRMQAGREEELAASLADAKSRAAERDEARAALAEATQLLRPFAEFYRLLGDDEIAEGVRDAFRAAAAFLAGRAGSRGA